MKVQLSSVKKLKNIIFFGLIQNELFSLCDTMCAGDWDKQGRKAKNKLADIPQLVLEPKRLVELLHICTLITQGQKPSFVLDFLFFLMQSFCLLS